MSVFFTDLDNTLIYSHRHDIVQDKILAECINGKEQSYMTRFTYEFLKRAAWMDMVPVTTRTKEQYGRFEQLMKRLCCNRALVCNGGILLEDGRVDREWLRDTMDIAGDELLEVLRAKKLINGLVDPVHVHYIEEMLLYICDDNAKYIFERLNRGTDKRLVGILRNRKKVYCIPRSITKGRAVKRYQDRYGKCFSMAAGDSELDIPLLEAGDISFVPEGLAKKVQNVRKIIVNAEGVISDEICSKIETLHKKGIIHD